MILQISILCVLAASVTAQLMPAAIVVRPPPYTSVIATETIKLACVAYGSPTPSYITWTADNGKDIQTLATSPDSDSEVTVTISQEVFTGEGIAMRVSMLEICNIDTTFTGNYTCTASNGVSGDGIVPSWATFFLSVTEPFTMPPAIVVRPPIDNTVEAGNTVEFGCIAYGNPVPNIYWSRPGCSDIKNSSAENLFVYSSTVTVNDVTMRKSVLQICNVDRGDEAQYGCWADNGVTVGKSLANSSFWFNVNVNVPTTAPPPTSTSRGSQGMTDAPTADRGIVNEDTTPYLAVVIVLVIVILVLILLLIVSVIYGMKMKKLSENKTNYSVSMGAVNPAGEEYDSTGMGAVNPAGEEYNYTGSDTHHLVEEDTKEDLYSNLVGIDEGTDD